MLKIPTELQNSDWRTYSAETETAICTICQGIMGTFIKLRRHGMSAEDIASKIIKLCTTLNIQNERVCKGVVELNAVIYMHRLNLIKYICTG